MKLNKNKPPKNREFLGLVDTQYRMYWDIFFWATKEDGVSKSCFTDRGLFAMPDIVGWCELPDILEMVEGE